MDTPYAFVTLVTSDYYLPGALAVAAALKDQHPSHPVSPEVAFQTLCLVTPESVDVSTIKLLRRAFNIVIGVEIIEQEDGTGLQLLGRPDLNLVLTKLHIFRLTQYAKLIFLDADVLPIRPMSHLFTIPHEFAAVPDVGWPDIFNSGVLVFTPGEEKFKELTALLKSKGSWDGGDQGILNEWRGDAWHRLSFTYNTTPTAVYTYAPAYERFGSQISAIHFIGPNKPWVSITYRPPGIKYSQLSEKSQNAPTQSYNYESLVDRWFDVYDRHYRSDSNPEHVNFEFTRYDSVWDAGTTYGVDITRPPSASPSGAVLRLDDLRKIAVEGISSYTSAAQTRPKVGEYRSMPLEGRVDLMRPRKEHARAEKGDAVDDQCGDQNITAKQAFIALEGGEVPRMETLPTPLPHELPSAPYHRPLELGPSVPPTPAEQPYAAEQQQRQQTGPYTPLTSEPGSVPLPLGVSWVEKRSLPQSESHYQESEQSDDPAPATTSRQPPWKGSTRPASPLAERHHRKDANHARHGYFSPRGSGYHSPRGIQSPRGVQSPRGHHSPTHTRHSPPPAVRRHSEHSHHPPPFQHIPHQHSSLHQHQLHQRHQHLPVSHPQGHRQHPHVPPPSSPPKLEWNPAIEPPPKTPPPPSAFPSDTYFPNIWDQAPSPGHDTSYQSFPGHLLGPKSEMFFQPPPPSEIPAQLLREGQYEQVIGRTSGEQEGNVTTAPAPDRTKVHAVFPWEEKPRHAPRRVFPAYESAPPVANFIDETVPAFLPAAEHSPSLSQVLSPPPIMHPFNLAYSNAWDTVPSIQKYASRLVSPRHSVFQPPPPEHDDSWRKWDEEREREYQDKQDASSMDGDDEDEGDDEDNRGQPARHDSDSGRERPQPRRSRAGSNASLTSGKSKKYRGRGVQTIPIESRSMGVQVNASAEEVEAARKGKQPKLDRGSGLAARHGHAGAFLLPAVTFNADPDQMAVGSPMTQPSQASVFPFPTEVSPTELRPSQTLGSPRTYSPPKAVSPKAVPSPPRMASSPKPFSPPNPRGSSSPRAVKSPRRLSAPQVPTSKLALSPQTSSSPAVGPSADSSPHLSPKLARLTAPPLQRMSSNDTVLTTSTSTSGPVETPEGTPILGPQAPPQRKGGRVWDPARGVDVFKRASEDVLARFLRSGSFEEEDGQTRHV